MALGLGVFFLIVLVSCFFMYDQLAYYGLYNRSPSVYIVNAGEDVSDSITA